MVDMPGLTNRELIPHYVGIEMPDAYLRALTAGAKLPLEYVGAGMYGIVLCDKNDHAWKIARLAGTDRDEEFMLESAASEYEWLRDAAGTSIAKNVAKVYRLHPEEIILERECVRGRAGGWNDGKALSKLHHEIYEVMEKEGWTAPEFKENSYVIKDDGTPVLVDISMAMRVGMNLAGWVEDVLNGKRKTQDRWTDLAFYLLRERSEKAIPEPLIQELLDRLVAKDPEIAHRFNLKG